MADIADLAQEHIEMELKMMKLSAQSYEEKAKPTGECLWCGEPLENDRRWCDAECRDSWEKWKKE